MKIIEVKENKKKYIELLILADEQEDMIDKYIDKGTMFILYDNGVKSECIITDEGNGVVEIKNIATLPEYQNKGYGKYLIKFIEEKYKHKFNILRVGTGDSILTIPFYKKCGFKESYRIKNFFVDNYNNPIFECGVQLIDMVYLEKTI
ncbi:GNAT family N-acetyltransferase [Tyzzerella sp. An114]|uniref:GNAT family N-acetyltransferase n=1 Tax=Tyzzerella sp. An114 TaxID=1965545 RepID=UPI000B43C8C8|nr:GNAT family N-acetyltransferase [Tyzzerella sp. An114]OUQ59709.1 GNAT family N-acetyltransferase [Tyzzerella sp. An114]HIT73539.1 GNAT family N-acetyltransferase [Candidatus Fimicola cottocaccae]